MIAETNYLWIIYGAIGAGIIFVVSIIETELGNRREARRKSALVLEPTKHEPADNSGTLIPKEPFKNVVRGYDSPQLFRDDVLIRLQELEREIADDLKYSK